MRQWPYGANVRRSLASWTPAPDQRYVGLDPGLINEAEQN